MTDDDIIDIYGDPEKTIRWQPLAAGRPATCSCCDDPLPHPAYRKPHMIRGEMCAYLCDYCTVQWFGPFVDLEDYLP